ncbi:SH3 domain-containing protein [Hellea balneolensis]|uniref:SH3 domain-containing protein n=1 Tax=Hellea balneolensis TaxID=287478 RepID=UPI000688FCA4|nr:SH3 domain-containing protein [Hellea balneolensis]
MNRFSLILGLMAGITTASQCLAQDIAPKAEKPAIKRIVEEIPPQAADVENFYRVSAAKTPSGFPVPRYVSLKVGKVNGRIGPSRKHPIAWQYRRKGLPLIVVAETEMWRKVRDVTGDESWIHKPALSGIRRVLVLEQTTLHSKAKASARITALVERNALLELEDCNEADWCKVKSSNGLKGWTRRYNLWGAQKLY